MKNVLNVTHKYNQKHLNSTRSFIQLYISLIPGINITEDIQATLDLIEQVNSKQKYTVPVILLHYPALILNSKTVRLIRYEISITKSLVKNNFWLSIGLILDIRNCPGSAAYFENLKSDLNVINLIIFMAYDNSTKQFVSESYQYFLCYEELNRNTNLIQQYRNVGFFVNSPIKIEAKDNSSTVIQNRASLEKFLNITANFIRRHWFHFIVEIEGTFDYNLRTNTFNKFSVVNVIGDWSQDFDRNSIGVALSSIKNPLLLPHTLSNFNKIIVQPRIVDVVNAGDDIYGKLLSNIVAYHRIIFRVRNTYSYEKSNNLAADVDSEDVFVVSHGDIISTIRVGNSTFPGIITGILIKYEDFMNTDAGENVGAKQSDGKSLTHTNEIKNTTSEIIDWAEVSL